MEALGLYSKAPRSHGGAQPNVSVVWVLPRGCRGPTESRLLRVLWFPERIPGSHSLAEKEHRDCLSPLLPEDSKVSSPRGGGCCQILLEGTLESRPNLSQCLARA